MTQQTLSITYTGQAAASKDLLQLEQSAWGAYTSRVTRAEMVRYLSALLYGTEYTSSVDCGLVSGAVVCVVAAYPRVADLVYRLHTSHGSLSSPTREMPLLTEALSFRLTTEVSPDHPIREIKSVEWLTECYNAEGAVVDPPALSIDGERITIPSAVYGSVSVTYRTERHSYVLTAPRRDSAIDNYYSAAVYGLYEGGINWLVVEMPPGIDAFEADPDADCGWDSSATVTNPERDPYPVSDSVHTRTTTVDYCSQEIIEDTVA